MVLSWGEITLNGTVELEAKVSWGPQQPLVSSKKKKPPHATCQVASTSWPLGPTTLNELFTWAAYNADILLNKCAMKDIARSNLNNLMKCDIVINEAYGGVGTGAYTLHLQHSRMKRTGLSLNDHNTYMQHISTLGSLGFHFITLPHAILRGSPAS